MSAIRTLRMGTECCPKSDRSQGREQVSAEDADPTSVRSARLSFGEHQRYVATAAPARDSHRAVACPPMRTARTIPAIAAAARTAPAESEVHMPLSERGRPEERLQRPLRKLQWHPPAMRTRPAKRIGQTLVKGQRQQRPFLNG